MSITTLDDTMENQDTLATTHTAEPETNARSLFTQQTGQALITLGTLFKHVPPFNESIDKSTGDTLIAIGKKLKRNRQA